MRDMRYVRYYALWHYWWVGLRRRRLLLSIIIRRWVINALLRWLQALRHHDAIEAFTFDTTIILPAEMRCRHTTPPAITPLAIGMLLTRGLWAPLLMLLTICRASRTVSRSRYLRSLIYILFMMLYFHYFSMPPIYRAMPLMIRHSLFTLMIAMTPRCSLILRYTMMMPRHAWCHFSLCLCHDILLLIHFSFAAIKDADDVACPFTLFTACAAKDVHAAKMLRCLIFFFFAKFRAAPCWCCYFYADKIITPSCYFSAIVADTPSSSLLLTISFTPFTFIAFFIYLMPSYSSFDDDADDAAFMMMLSYYFHFARWRRDTKQLLCWW